MRFWNVTTEPTLEDLLDDEIMEVVVRSAGLSRGDLRRQLIEIARRLQPAAGAAAGVSRDRSCSRAAA